MFRPTHFVILFAVVLCAAAFPGPPAGPLGEGPLRTPDVSQTAPKLPVRGPSTVSEPAKGDLDTDATHYAYAYYGPGYGYYGPGFRSYGWGPYIW